MYNATPSELTSITRFGNWLSVVFFLTKLTNAKEFRYYAFFLAYYCISHQDGKLEVQKAQSNKWSAAEDELRGEVEVASFRLAKVTEMIDVELNRLQGICSEVVQSKFATNGGVLCLTLTLSASIQQNQPSDEINDLKLKCQRYKNQLRKEVRQRTELQEELHHLRRAKVSLPTFLDFRSSP